MKELEIGDKLRVDEKIIVAVSVNKEDYCCNICELQDNQALCNHINCHGAKRADGKYIVFEVAE